MDEIFFFLKMRLRIYSEEEMKYFLAHVKENMKIPEDMPEENIFRHIELFLLSAGFKNVAINKAIHLEDLINELKKEYGDCQGSIYFLSHQRYPSIMLHSEPYHVDEKFKNRQVTHRDYEFHDDVNNLTEIRIYFDIGCDFIEIIKGNIILYRGKLGIKGN